MLTLNKTVISQTIWHVGVPQYNMFDLILAPIKNIPLQRQGKKEQA